MIEGKCFGGPHADKVIAQYDSCREFNVERLEMGESKIIGKYILHTIPVIGGRYVEWHYERR